MSCDDKLFKSKYTDFIDMMCQILQNKIEIRIY